MRTFRQFLEAQFPTPTLDNHFDLQVQLDHLEENPNLQNMKDFLTNWTKPFEPVYREVTDLSREFYAWTHNNHNNYNDNQYDYRMLFNLSSYLSYFRREDQGAGAQINQATVKSIGDTISDLAHEANRINEFIDRFLMPERQHNMFEHLIQTLTSLEKYIKETIPLLQRAKKISKGITY
jgi:hypothetical protein